MKLSPKELGSLLERFDGDGDGTVNGTEFLLEFCKIKNAATKAVKIAKEAEARKAKEYYDKLGETYLERFAKVKEVEMDANFGEKDYESAMRKLEKVSLFFDPARSNVLRGFQGWLNPTAFASQLKRCFNIQLNSKELGAMVKHFDLDNSGTIDGTEFVIGFNNMSHEAKKKEKQRIMKEGALRKNVVRDVEKKFKMKFKKKMLRLPSLDKDKKNNNAEGRGQKVGDGREGFKFNDASLLRPNSMVMSSSTYMDTSIGNMRNFDDFNIGSAKVPPLNGRVSTAQARGLR